MAYTLQEMIMKTLLPVLATLALTAPVTAFGQEAALEAGSTDSDYTVNQLIIYGDDECPQSTGNEIVVCARKSENERYRIPENLRLSGDPANESWTKRVLSYETNSPYGQYACTPVGATGAAGCTAELIDQAFEERATGQNVRFSQLIEEARAERLSEIDERTAEEQDRVEQIEREYMERIEREQQAEADAADAEPLPSPTQP